MEPDWLVNLYGYCKANGGNIIVSGKVISDLPRDISDEIKGLFNKKDRPTGRQLQSCATDNVLIPSMVFTGNSLRFDICRPLAGGTDTMFFCAAAERGFSIVKCAEAVVHEQVPANRLSLNWMAKRKYRSGITVAWRKRRSGRFALSILFSALAQVGINVTKSLLYCIGGKKMKRNLSWLEVCRSLGVLSGVMGLKIDSYRNTDGQ